MTESRIVDVPGVGEVRLDRSARARRTIITVKTGRGVRVAVPSHVSFEDALDFVRRKQAWVTRNLARIRAYEAQKQAADAVFRNLDRRAARRELAGRLDELARRYGYTYGRVSIRNQRTRWGSCSGRGDISLNIKLVALPQDLQDYVILHELAHTRVHNHSQQFWAELNKHVENPKAKARALVEYGLRLL